MTADASVAGGFPHPALPATTTTAIGPSATPNGRSPVGRRIALFVLLSLLIHAGTTLWPGPDRDRDDSPAPLQATLRSIPPPPRPAPPPEPVIRPPEATPKARPVPQRRPPRPVVEAPPVITTPPTPAEVPAVAAVEVPPDPRADAPIDTPVSSPVATAEGEVLPPVAEPSGPPAVAEPAEVPAQSVASEALPPPDAAVATPALPSSVAALPPVVDLVYTAYLGTNGFVIGTMAYRFEHEGSNYRIETLGRGRGIVALLYPGHLKIRSRGKLAADGLRPDEFSVERGGTDRFESTAFDHRSGELTLHRKPAQPMEGRTYDLLTFWLQFYFAPPAGDEIQFRVATTRTIREFTLRRMAPETVVTPLGEVATEVWRRVDGKEGGEATVWLAPEWHFLPVKVRVSGARGTVEQLIQGIRSGLPVSEAMTRTRKLEIPLDREGEVVQPPPWRPDNAPQ